MCERFELWELYSSKVVGTVSDVYGLELHSAGFKLKDRTESKYKSNKYEYVGQTPKIVE